ncbi:hypothetical protein [Flavobacterium sp.]|uniref:hypothetical protein n=1 Tax=Flavobacterium sp. TaxID=239 RepID=UPI003B9B2BAC
MNHAFTRSIHILFFSVSLVFIVRKQFDQALIYGGLALAFDPFNVNVKWSDRPNWQRIVLIGELLLVFACFGLTLFQI